MLNILIPRFKYWKSAPAGETSYPNLQDDAEGLPIPEGYGILKNVTPICIDKMAWKYKFTRRGLHAIDAIRDAGVPLVLGADYSEDLPNGEFSIITSPYLTAGVTYYFVVEADFPVHASNHIHFWQFDEADVVAAGQVPYADGNLFTIDNTGVWTPVPNFDLRFLICGKADLADPWHHQVDNRYSYVPRPPHTLIGLRDDNARYWLAQSFKPLINFYCTAVVLEVKNPAGILGQFRTFILNAQANPAAPGAALLSARSHWNNRDSGPPGHGHTDFPFRTEVSNIVGDIQALENPDTSLMENVADVLKDIYVNVIGGSAAGINAGDLVTLKAARTQDTALYMAEEKQAQRHIEILEAGHLFKFLPSLNGDFAVRCLTAGEPAGTPHLKTEHIRNFTMRRIWSNVFQTAKIKYYRDPTTDDWLVAEEKSEIAEYLYNRRNSIEIETDLKDAADATQAAKDYLGTDPASTRKVNLQYPTRVAEFDVLAGYGFDLIPTMKVKITLARADYAGGALNAILFRILEVHKNPDDGSSRLVTLLDSLTY